MFGLAEELITNTVKQIGNYIYRRLIVDCNLQPLKLDNGDQIVPDNGYMICSRKSLVDDIVAIVVIPIQQGKPKGVCELSTKNILRKLESFHSWLFYRSDAIPIC